MKFRKKPVVIEAEQYRDNVRIYLDTPEDSPLRAICVEAHTGSSSDVPHIHTLEGSHLVSEGDWIIRGVKGEHYPCKPDIFEMTYEVVDNEPIFGRLTGGDDL